MHKVCQNEYLEQENNNNKIAALQQRKMDRFWKSQI